MRNAETIEERSAEELLEELRRLSASVSAFEFLSSAQRRRVNTAASLPDAFLESVAAAIDDFPQLAAACQTSADELRDAIAFTRSYAGVIEELELLARGIRDTIAARRARAGRGALLAYALAKRLDGDALREHVERMRANVRAKR